MGHINSVALAQTISSTLAKVAADQPNQKVHLDVYIDNILVLGEEAAIQSFDEKFRSLCKQVNATIGETEICSTNVTHCGMLSRSIQRKRASFKKKMWIIKFAERGVPVSVQVGVQVGSWSRGLISIHISLTIQDILSNIISIQNLNR